MATCAYCHDRKGKRSCPALADTICPRCCGEHRQREISCPSDCQHLPSPSETSSSIDQLQARLIEFALKEDKVAAEPALVKFLGPERKLADWEQPSLLGYVVYGHEDATGERSIDRFRRRHGATLTRDGLAELESLERAWPSLFEIVSVERDVGLTLRDVIGGGEVRVRERQATHQLKARDRILAWIQELAGVTMLTGAAASVPPAHNEVVERALRDAVDRARARDPSAPLRTLVRRSLAIVHTALRAAIRDWKPPEVRTREGYEVGSHRAVYEILDPAAARERLAAIPALEETGSPGRFSWLEAGAGPTATTDAPEVARSELVALTPTGPRRIFGQIELRTVRLTLECFTAEHLARGKRLLEKSLRDLLRHRVDSSETLATQFERGRAQGEVPDDDAPFLELEPALSPEEAHSRIAAAVEDWARNNPEPKALPAPARREPSLGDRPKHHRLPPLPRELLAELVPGLEVLLREGAVAARQEPGWEVRALTAEQVGARPEVKEFLLSHARGLVGRGAPPQRALVEADLLGRQVDTLLNFEVHRRKTFWADEALAWALLATDLDVEGACLRLPFPACAFVFVDRASLELGESLLLQDPDSRLRDRALSLLTVHTTLGAGTPETGQKLRLGFFFDAADGDWPFFLERDLFLRPKDDLAKILDSHVSGVSERSLDTIFLAPELKKLTHLVLNAILYATSAHLDATTVGPAPRKARARDAGAHGGRASRKIYSAEDVFYLPGKIPISSVRSLRVLEEAPCEGIR